jgi:hypothetical protein
MRVKEYLELAQIKPYADVTFIKARARKDANTPYYHQEYQTTPIRTVSEWSESKLMDYIVLNDKQPPIEWASGAHWINKFNRGDLVSLLVISEDDIRLLYSESQALSTELYIDKKIKEKLNKK